MRTAVEPGPTRRDLSTEVFPWVAGLLGAVAALVWAGAALAAVFSGGSAAAVSLPGAVEALVRLPSHLGAPAIAWPEPARSNLPGPVAYWACQVAVVAAVGGVAWGAWRGWRRVVGRPVGALGVSAEAGFASGRDLRRLTVARPEEGRLTIGRVGAQLLACERAASLAVVGPTGCGKTAGFAIPALLEWRGPVIATSVKADLLEATIEHRRRRGDVWVYDPTGCSGHPTSTWSPLVACTTWSGAVRTAAWMTEAAQPRLDTVSDGDYWYSQARKGLAPYLHAAAVSGKTVADLVRWVDTQDVDQVEDALMQAADGAVAEVAAAEGGSQQADDRWEELWWAAVELCRDELRSRADPVPYADEPVGRWPVEVTEKIAETVEAEWQSELVVGASTPSGDELASLVAARALWGKEARLRGSVFATMENVLAGWADPGVGAAARGSSMDVGKWLAGDNTLYVVATAHEQARLRPVLTVLVQQAVRAAYDRAAAQGGRLEHPCLVLLDEAGNIAPLRDLPGYASTARSHGITLVTVWQDLAQIRAAYHDRAQTVLNNHRAKLFGTGIADQSTLEYVSRLIGDEHRTERNLSAELHGGRRTLSEHRTYRRAAPVDVLRRIRPDEAVLLYGSELPAHVRLRPWFTDHSLRAIAERDELIIHERRRRALLHR
jgi:type IV secretion system protein VirD4